MLTAYLQPLVMCTTCKKAQVVWTLKDLDCPHRAALILPFTQVLITQTVQTPTALLLSTAR